jgi:hypothetical protein
VEVEGALASLVAVARALEAAGARFLVGGSFASSLQGIPLSTQDVDLVAESPLAASRPSRRRSAPISTATKSASATASGVAPPSTSSICATASRSTSI